MRAGIRRKDAYGHFSNASTAGAGPVDASSALCSTLVLGYHVKNRLQWGTNVAGVKVYGADWCGDTQRALQHLDKVGVPYDYIDVEKDHRASEWVKQQNGGKERKPTIEVNGHILTVPSTSELDNALRESGASS